MKPSGSAQNLQRTRKQMCLMSEGEQPLKPVQKRSKFDEMVERLGNMRITEEPPQHRKTKSEVCILNDIPKPPTVTHPLEEEEFFITEIIADDAKPFFINKNDKKKSEEFSV